MLCPAFRVYMAEVVVNASGMMMISFHFESPPGDRSDADSDINRMGGWPRVVFGRRPSFGESRVTIDPQMPGSVTFSAKLVRARVLTGPLILAWMKEYLGYTSYPQGYGFQSVTCVYDVAVIHS